MWSFLIIFYAPLLNNPTGMVNAHKPILIQAFIPQLPVKTFHKSIINWFPRPTKLKFNPSFISPGIKRITDKLRRGERATKYSSIFKMS